MNSDGTHDMTMDVTTRADKVKVYQAACKEPGCTRSSGPFPGPDGKITVEQAVRTHAALTKTQAEVRRRNGG